MRLLISIDISRLGVRASRRAILLSSVFLLPSQDKEACSDTGMKLDALFLRGGAHLLPVSLSRAARENVHVDDVPFQRLEKWGNKQGLGDVFVLCP